MRTLIYSFRCFLFSRYAPTSNFASPCLTAVYPTPPLFFLVLASNIFSSFKLDYFFASGNSSSSSSSATSSTNSLGFSPLTALSLSRILLINPQLIACWRMLVSSCLKASARILKFSSTASFYSYCHFCASIVSLLSLSGYPARIFRSRSLNFLLTRAY